MPDLRVMRVDEIPSYEGSNAIPGIRFHLAGRELGVTAWGMNIIEIETGCTAYPEHDHAQNGQEEVYVVLKGSGRLESGGKATDLTEGVLVRVGPQAKRKFLPGPQGITLLVIGGTPGQAYSK